MDRTQFSSAPATERRPAIRMLHAANRLYASVFHQLNVHAPCSLPDTGPGLLVCNHISHLDPMLLQACCRRVIVWMMTRDFYDRPHMHWFFRTLEAIPVAGTGRDMTAMRSAMRALESGRIIGIFPEGGIARAGELRPFQTGVALMALKTGVPVYPAALEGTSRNTRFLEAIAWPQEAHLAFGAPVTFDRSSADRNDLDAITQRLQDRVQALLTFVNHRRRGERAVYPG